MDCQKNVMLLEGQAVVVSRGHVIEELVGIAKKLGVFSKDVGEKSKGFKQELKSNLHLYMYDSPCRYYTVAKEKDHVRSKDGKLKICHSVKEAEKEKVL